MQYYKAIWIRPTEVYFRWDGVPHLLINNKEYIISVEQDKHWSYIVTVYTEKGKQITKIPYNVNPNNYWQIIESLA